MLLFINYYFLLRERGNFIMKQFCALIGKFFGIIAIVFLVLGLTMPQNFLWVLGKVHGISVLSCMLGIVMFGMGTTLNLKDFALVLKRPLDIIIGCCAQYFVMPFLAYLLSVAFNLDPALTTGVVLVGTCPAVLLQRNHLYVQGRRCTFRNHDQCFHCTFSDSDSVHHLHDYR